jgi:threonine synthase
MIALATAHPAKFPDAVNQSVGQRPALPKRLDQMMEKEERFVILANDLNLVRSYVSDNSKTNP